MKKSNQIVRVRRIENTDEPIDRWTCDIYLTTFREYLSETMYICSDRTIELYPYRWYEIEKIWQVPIFYFRFSSLGGRHPKTILPNVNPAIKATVTILSWLIILSISYFITDIIYDTFLKPLIKSYLHLA
jgi:hypothetical protein